MDEFTRRRDAALREQLQLIPGAAELVAAADEAFEGRIACASNSERAKVELQLEKTGLLAHFTGKIFSAAETGPAKPSPAVYLAAAESMGPAAQRPLVLEDSPRVSEPAKPPTLMWWPWPLPSIRRRSWVQERT